MEIENPTNFGMPTDSLSEDHKQALDKLSCKMSVKHLRHAANHLNNKADELDEHARKSVTWDDFQKAKKHEEETEE